MENYGWITIFLGFAGFFISILTGIVHGAWKRTFRYLWVFGCIAGFCFCMVFSHLLVLLAYDDISSPNYEAYKDWSLWRFVLSDGKCLMVWLGIGILNYLAFIKKNRVLRNLLLLGLGLALILLVVLVIVSSMSVIVISP